MDVAQDTDQEPFPFRILFLFSVVLPLLLFFLALTVPGPHRPLILSLVEISERPCFIHPRCGFVDVAAGTMVLFTVIQWAGFSAQWGSGSAQWESPLVCNSVLRPEAHYDLLGQLFISQAVLYLCAVTCVLILAVRQTGRLLRKNDMELFIVVENDKPRARTTQNVATQCRIDKARARQLGPEFARMDPPMTVTMYEEKMNCQSRF